MSHPGDHAAERRPSKVLSMQEAIATHVRDGDVVALEGFTHLIPFAAGHEIIRQRRRDLTLVRLTPDLIADQLVAAGCVDKVVFGWMGNPAIGSLHALRRRVEHGDPGPLEVEEYSHFALMGRYIAGASGMPFHMVGAYTGSDLAHANPNVRKVTSPFEDGAEAWAVAPLRPDVAVLHAQRADRNGNVQLWGLTGMQREVAYAARRTVIVVEELVDEAVVRADPSRTAIPGVAVDAVVVCPWGAHPSYAQGYYDRDNRFYREWEDISRDPERLADWLQSWVHELPDHEAYAARLGEARRAELTPRPSASGQVSYGSYR